MWDLLLITYFHAGHCLPYRFIITIKACCYAHKSVNLPLAALINLAQHKRPHKLMKISDDGRVMAISQILSQKFVTKVRHKSSSQKFINLKVLEGYPPLTFHQPKGFHQ